MSSDFFHRVDKWLAARADAAQRRRAEPETPSPNLPGIRLGREQSGSDVEHDPGGAEVFVMFDYTFPEIMKREHSWAKRAQRPVLIVLGISCSLDGVKREIWRENMIKEHLARYPMHTFLMAANVEADVAGLASMGLDAVWCSHNAWVDEELYRPLEGAQAGEEREFDAIYDARYARFKRHELAVRIKRLALISYDVPHLRETSQQLWVRWHLRHAVSLNERKGLWFTPQILGRDKVAAAYLRASCGLCLSESEGAMLASVQYLLSGLPVVTTPSVGGRDVFFDVENSITVRPEANAVADGVREALARRSNPQAIRSTTIARMNEHRARLADRVAEWQAAHGVPEGERARADAAEWRGGIFR